MTKKGQGARQREKAEGALTELFQQYQVELDTRNDTQERIYKCARDVIIESKRVIFTLQRCARADTEQWDAILSEAREKMELIKTKTVTIRQLMMAFNDQFIFQRAYDFGLEEFIEAIGFYWFLAHDRMPTHAEIEKEINIDEENVPLLQIDPAVYVFGLADVAGEVMRFTTSTIDPAVTHKSVNFLRHLHSCYVSLEEKKLIYRTKSMHQKVTVMMQSLTKLEHLAYRIKIRQLEFGDESSDQIMEMLKRDLSERRAGQDAGFSED